jgi:hypothetical protein
VGMQEKRGEEMMDLEQIAEEIRTQDNRATESPIFILFDRVKMPTDRDYSDDYIYHDADNDDCDVDGNREALLKYIKDEFDTITYSPIGVNRKEDLDKLSEDQLLDIMENDRTFYKVHVKTVNEFKQAFFTNKSAQEFLEANRHRFDDPFIYCDSMYRNYEMQAIRNALINGAFKRE